MPHSKTNTPLSQNRPSLRRNWNPGPLRSVYKKCKIFIQHSRCFLRNYLPINSGLSGTVATPPPPPPTLRTIRYIATGTLDIRTSPYFMCVNTNVKTQVLWQETLCLWVNNFRSFRRIVVSPKCHKIPTQRQSFEFWIFSSIASLLTASNLPL